MISRGEREWTWVTREKGQDAGLSMNSLRDALNLRCLETAVALLLRVTDGGSRLGRTKCGQLSCPAGFGLGTPTEK